MLNSYPLIVGGVVISGAVLSSLATPLLQRLAFGKAENNWLQDELEFDRIDHDDCTIILKDESFARVIKIDGQQYDTASMEVQQNMLTARSAMFFVLGELGVTSRLFAIKRKTDFSHEADYPTEVLSEIGAKEQKLYSSSYDLEWFMLLSSTNFGKLDKACDRVTSILRDYGTEVLERSQLMVFINYLITGEFVSKDTICETSNISVAVHGTDISVDKNTGIIETSTPSHHYNKILTVREWPDLLDGMLAADIMALYGDIELCQVAIPKGVDKAKTELLTSRQEQESLPEIVRNSSLLEDINDVIEIINDGKSLIYNIEYIITFRSKTLEGLNKLNADIGDILSKRRIQWSNDTSVALSYYFNRMPYNNKLLRPLRVLNQNIAALWAFHNSASGQKISPWGNLPLRLFKSSIGKIYNFNFHVTDDISYGGHFLIFAPTGGGKSTLLMHLLGGLSKFDRVRSFIFDSKEGTRWMVEAMGGNYQSIESLEFNPFKCDDTQANRLYLERLLKQMGNATSSEINLLLNTIFSLDIEERSLNNVFNYVFNETGSKAIEDYQRWVTDHKGVKGNYANIFNHDYDSLSDVLSGSFMTAINMADILEDKILAPPLVTHIMNSIGLQAQTNHHGFCVFVDEAAALLKNKNFAEALLVMFREYRKLNGVVGMAFQDPQALEDSGISEAILSNTTTLIFYPNKRAKRESFKHFGLSEEELDFVTGRSSDNAKRSILIVKNNAATGAKESIILDADLSNYGDVMRWYRSGNEANLMMKDLQEKFGDQWRSKI